MKMVNCESDRSRSGCGLRRITSNRRIAFQWVALAAWIVCLASPAVQGQDANKKGGLGLDLSKLNLPEVPASEAAPPPATSESPDGQIVEETVADVPKVGLGKLPGSPAADAGPMTLVAEYTSDGKGKGQLLLTATLDGSWHTYSTTQPPGGPKPSKISIKTPGVKIAGTIQSDKEPHIHQVPEYTVPVEEHHERVVWTAPLEFSGDFKPGESELKVKYDGLVCDNACREVRQELVAKYVSAAAPVEQTAFRNERSHASFTARIEPAEVKPGGMATLILHVTCDPGYHIYSFVPRDKDPKFKTLMVPTQKGDLKWGEPTTTAKAEVDNSQGFDVLWHEGEFEWKIPLQVPEATAEGPQNLELAVMYLTCTKQNCDMPAGFTAKGTLNVVKSPGATAQAPLELTVTKSPNFAAKQPNVATWIDEIDEPKADKNEKPRAPATGNLKSGELSLMTILFALAGGFILNFMPCVLPVIGLKVLGFVEQAGSAKGEVIRLNLAYVLGICTVMWTLAGVTVGMQKAFGETFGWGQQFTIFEFKLAMAALVFAMALSFLGVWEIPIPGFATSYKSNQMMQREGLFGAFAKGLFTTILATPCSGPFLGVVFAVTSTLDPTGVFVVYTMVGLAWACHLLPCVSSPMLSSSCPSRELDGNAQGRIVLPFAVDGRLLRSRDWSRLSHRDLLHVDRRMVCLLVDWKGSDLCRYEHQGQDLGRCDCHCRCMGHG